MPTKPKVRGGLEHLEGGQFLAFDWRVDQLQLAHGDVGNGLQCRDAGARQVKCIQVREVRRDDLKRRIIGKPGADFQRVCRRQIDVPNAGQGGGEAKIPMQ